MTFKALCDVDISHLSPGPFMCHMQAKCSQQRPGHTHNPHGPGSLTPLGGASLHTWPLLKLPQLPEMQHRGHRPQAVSPVVWLTKSVPHAVLCPWSGKSGGDIPTDALLGPCAFSSWRAPRSGARSCSQHGRPLPACQPPGPGLPCPRATGESSRSVRKRGSQPASFI